MPPSHAASSLRPTRGSTLVLGLGMSLLALVQPIRASAQTPPASTLPDSGNYSWRLPYQTQMEDYFATMKGKPCDLLFIGDSITEQWRWGPGKPVWDKHYATRGLNFGLGSDRTQHALWRLKNLPLEGFSPKVAIILIGTNNHADAPENIAAGVRAVTDATREKFSGIKVVLVSILPNARANATTQAANVLLAKVADHQSVFYLDLAAKFTLEGDNWKGLTQDKLHLSTAGYEIWAAELNQLLPQVLR